MAYVVMNRRIVPKFEEICFSVVIDNLEEIISKPDSEQDIAYLKLKSQRLMNAFKNSHELVPRECAHIFFNSYLTKLEFCYFEESAFPYIISQLKTMGHALTVVNARTSHFSVALTQQLTHSLPESIESLSLSHCTDEMLKTVAERCPDLINLDLNFCNEISDSGIRFLCHKNDNGEVCKNFKLQKLELCATRVTEKTIIFALQYFPNLTGISGDAGSVICELNHSSSLNGANPDTYNLKSLNVRRSCMSYYNVLYALSVMCPFVNSLEVKIVSQAELNACIEFTQLEVFRCEIREPCNFLPFLQARGSSLKMLSICGDYNGFQELKYLSADAVVKFCSQLESLYLHRVRLTELGPFASSNEQYTLPNLEVLFVENLCQDHLEESLIFLISRSTNLQKFIFENKRLAIERNMFPTSTFSDSFIDCISMSTLNKLCMRNVDIDVYKLQGAMSNFTCDCVVR